VVVIVWLLDLQLPVQSVHITTKAVNLNPAHGEVHSCRGALESTLFDKVYRDLRRRVCGFLRFPPALKLIATIELKYY